MATPPSAMKPTAAGIVKGISRAANANTPPVSASGTATQTTSARRHAPTASHTRPNTTSATTGTSKIKRWRALSSCSNDPPNSTR